MSAQKSYFRRYWPFVLIFVLALVTVFSYAYWDSLEKSDDIDDITIGEGVTLSINKVVDLKGNLVPEEAVLKEGDVTEVVYTYTVSLDKEILEEEELNLVVECTNKAIDNNDALGDFFDVDINPKSTTIQNSPVEITVKVTLNAPTTKDEYDQIAGKQLSFTLNFTASKQE
ncbi:MAG TPA: hypothetical protein PLO54_06220 [Bacilli bacterium]|nr:hypothetical protein [Bacilli bacterium]